MNKQLHTIRNLITKTLGIGLIGFVTGIAIVSAQNSSTYTFSTNATSSLALDLNLNVVDMSTGTTQLVAAGLDAAASTVTAVGFPFPFMSGFYTQFAVQEDGVLQLGGAAPGTNVYTISGGTVAAPRLAAFCTDLRTGTSTGKIHYKLIGSAPQRVLVVEFKEMQLFYTGTGTAGTSTFQMRLYENGTLEYVYGTMSATDVATANRSPSVGFYLGAATNLFASVTTATHTVSVTSPYTANPAVAAVGPLTDLTSASNGTRRAYVFTPPPFCTTPVDQPTALLFSNIIGTQLDLSFTAAVSTPSSYLIVRYPTGAAVTNPVDAAAYVTGQALGLGTVVASTNTTTATATGLVPSTSYDFYVYSTQTGACRTTYNTASPLTLTQSTGLPINFTTTSTGGLWSAKATWVGGVVPSVYDSATVATGAVLTVDVATTVSTFILKNNSTVYLNAALIDSSDLIIGIGATFNGFFGTTGRQITVRRNITNDGTLNMAMPGGIVLLNGITPQTISGSGTFSLIPTLTVNNALGGVVLNSNITVSNALNLTNGIVSGTGTLTMGNIGFNSSFAMTSTGGRLSCTAASGLAGIIPGNATFTYNAPTPVGPITIGNELNIVAPTNMNVVFNAISAGNYILGSNINVNNATFTDSVDVSSFTVTVNGTASFPALANVFGNGTFTMGANATISTTNLLGITAASPSLGSVQTATRNYSATGNYTYGGAATQVTGDGLPTMLTAGTVTINSTSGTALSQSTQFYNLTLSTNFLTNGSDATVTNNANLGTLQVTGAGGFITTATTRLFLNHTHASGVIQTAANGNFTNTGTRTFAPGTDIVIGGSAVATGNGFPTTGVDSLVLNQTTVLVLTAATSVNTLFITSTGRMTTTDVNALTILGNQAGNVARNNTGYINGPITRTIGVGATGTFLFPLGAAAVGNLGVEVINPVVTGADITLTAIARSLPTGGSAGTGLTALTNTRYWAFAPVGGVGTLASVKNIRISESTAATLGGTSKKIGFTTLNAANAYNSIGGQLDSANVSILSSLAIPAFGTISDSTFLVFGNGTASGTFTGGTFTVGPTGNYFSLTQAIATMNENTSLSAPVVLEFQSTYSPSVETYPIVFRSTLRTTATNTITIRPSAAVSAEINFSAGIINSTALIDFNGGSNIIIDGRPGGAGTSRYIKLNQLTVGTFPTVRFINDAQNNTLKYLTVSGQNTSTTSALIVFGTGITTGNSNILIDNCTINGLSNTMNCITSVGSTTPADNKNVTISNNNIFDFFVNGGTCDGILTGAGTALWTINANNFYQTAIRNSFSVPAMTTATNFRAINTNSTATNAVYTITNNRVGGNIPGIPGSVFIIGDSNSALAHLIRPIDCSNAGTASPSSVQGNIISDITLYTNGNDNFSGIGVLQTGVYNVGNITPNLVGSTTTNGNITIYHRGTGAAVIRGYHFTNTGGGLLQNNIVSGIDFKVQGAQATGGSITFQGILAGATFTNPVTISGNTIGSTTLANSFNGLASSLGAIGYHGIMISGATGAAVSVTNNTISNLSSFQQTFSTGSSIRGINITGASSVSTTVSGNTITNLRCDAPNNSIDVNTVVIGIHNNTSGAGRQVISNNTIHSLTAPYNGPVANVAQAILYNSTNSSGTSLIERNVIHSLETGNSNVLATQIGINLGTAATTVQVFNNFMRLGVNINGTTNNANASFLGILKQNTTNTSVIYNSVYIGGSPSASDTLGLSAAFYRFNSSTIDTVMNNIFTNVRSNASGSGEHYAMNITNATGLRADANLSYAPGTGGIPYRVGFTRITSIQAWRTAQKPWELRSALGNPSFNAGITNSAATINFTLNAASPAATAAIPLAYITTDLAGNARPVAPAIGSYDLGLSALTATTDIYTPRISFVAPGNRPAASTAFNNVTVTDIGTGVSTSATAPRLWYKNATTASAWASVAPTSNTGTANNALFQYNFNWSLIGGAPSLNDKIMYYVVAQDLATSPNIWYSQYNNITPNHSSVTAQITPSVLLDSFLVVAPLNLNISIPTDYPSITGAGGLFEAINSAALGGNTTVTIMGDVNETGVNQLNNPGMAGFSLLIQPDGVLRTLWGNSTTSLIRLNGVSKVTIDGGPGKNLRILDSIGTTSSATVGATVEFFGGCTNDTLVNCIIEGNSSSTSKGTVMIGAGTNTNILIANNTIRAAENDTLRRPAIGIFSSNISNANIKIGGVTARPGGNIIYDFTSNGISLAIGDNVVIGSNTLNTDGNQVYNRDTTGTVTFINLTSGNNHIVANNAVYQSAGVITGAGTSFTGINISGGGTNHLITNNGVGGSDATRAGKAIFAGFFNGITINASTVVPSIVSKNLVSNIRGTNTTTSDLSNAILVNGGTVEVGGPSSLDGNIIGTQTDSLTSANSIQGIGIAAGNVKVRNNTIQGIVFFDPDFERSNGIFVSGASTDTITDNIIRDIKNYSNNAGYTLVNIFVNAGIQINAGSNHFVSRNTIYNLSTFSTTGNNPSIGIKINSAASTTISSNRIYGFKYTGTGTGTSAATGGCFVIGIQLQASSSGTTVFANNQISLGDGMGADGQFFGIKDEGSLTNQFYNNSIFINGVATGNNHSYGIFRNSTSVIDVKNNLIYNRRITSGTGKGFGVGSANAITSANLNYNMMFVNDTAALAQLGGTAQGWAALNTLYTTTYNTNWAERISVVPAPEMLFTDTLVGNLGIVTTNPEAWYVNGKGIRITGFTGDFNNVSGVRSGSIATGAVDIGSVEFTPSSVPPLTFADKVPTVNDSTQFFFASRMVAKAVWGVNGSLPTSVDVHYYSGVNPANTGVGKTRMNAYWDIAQLNGSGFDYALTLMHDSAVMGTVGAVSNLGIARYLGASTNWTLYNPTIVNAVTGMMSATPLTSVGIFTGTDISSNPLPVKLISFTAATKGNDAILNWNTATETNNKGFEIERSVNGRTFEKVNFVKGAGNSNKAMSYSLTDANAFTVSQSNVLYYRLKQVDLDGKYTYSNIVRVDKTTKEANALSVFPNPYSNDYSISFTAINEGSATVEIMDLQGKVVATKNAAVVNGANTISMTEASTVRAGIYFVRINVNGEMQTLKLVKN
jgi:hypothetical protein